jgi:hypothetical protein
MTTPQPAKVVGVYRDPSDVRIICVCWNKEPSDDDLRKTHDILRQMSAEPAGEEHAGRNDSS